MTSYLERFFSKTDPAEITYQDFLAFHAQGVEEHQHLEYKPRGLLVTQDDAIIKPPNPQAVVGFSALAKTVAGFANADGGLLVLGVKEKPERYRGTVVRIRPGAISALPLTVTRESIENQLMARIQDPIEGVRIVPLRASPRATRFVYLIDVPQSVRAPHRVDDVHYYQRYNFSTLPMKHFQIADLFGRRLAPDLEVVARKVPHERDSLGGALLVLTLHNRGRAVAKYVTCVCHLLVSFYQVAGVGEYGPTWPFYNQLYDRIVQFTGGVGNVVYPDLPCPVGAVLSSPGAPSHSSPRTLRSRSAFTRRVCRSSKCDSPARLEPRQR